VSQVVVVGDTQPFIAALITLDMEMLPTWLANNGEKKEMTLAEATTNPAVLAEIQRAVDHANTKVSRAESIRKFVVLPVELSEASGHLTPKLSIKRHVIVEDFADVIESMYEKAPSTEGLSLEH
jgi:long-chain acyl-CoA synthetase